MNLYGYCGNNPTNWTDPYGFVPINLITGNNYISDYSQNGSESGSEKDSDLNNASMWFPVPGKKGWDVRRDPPQGKYPAHDHYRYRKKPRSRRVYPDGTQKPHGKGVDKDVPEDVIERGRREIRRQLSRPEWTVLAWVAGFAADVIPSDATLKTVQTGSLAVAAASGGAVVILVAPEFAPAIIEAFRQGQPVLCP